MKHYATPQTFEKVLNGEFVEGIFVSNIDSKVYRTSDILYGVSCVFRVRKLGPMEWIKVECIDEDGVVVDQGMFYETQQHLERMYGKCFDIEKVA
jgi:hypothetical protein